MADGRQAQLRTGAAAGLDLERLRSIVGREHVLVERGLIAGAERDWTGRFRGSTPAMLRPGCLEEVASVVAALAEEGVAWVPQGGNTGLVAGAVPLGGEVVISTTRLRDGPGPSRGRGRGRGLDEEAGELVVGAGTTLAEAREAARAGGWELPIDLAARGSATIGGMIATDAAGLLAVRFGRMRARVLALQAVLPNGEVVDRLDGAPKDGTGYDLGGLLIGSEGTLGIVTAARLGLVRPRRHRATALVATDGLDAAASLARRLLGATRTLEALEVVASPGVELMAAEEGRRPPVGRPGQALVLVEAASDREVLEELAACLEAAPEADDVAVATEPERRGELWRWRECQTDAISRAGVPHKLDVGVRIDQIAQAAGAIEEALAQQSPEARLYLFGHLGEGNLHVNVLGVAPSDSRIDALVLELVAGLGGSIAAEHGVGRAKARYVALTRTSGELDAMRAVKRALDAGWLANPGVIFETPG